MKLSTLMTHHRRNGLLIGSLASNVCPACGRSKGDRKTFCVGCFRKLPSRIQRALYSRVDEGYDIAMIAACEHLGVQDVRFPAGAGGELRMKALSILQPWAWAIVHAGKRVENRTWSTSHRGQIAIHAGKSSRLLKTFPNQLPDGTIIDKAECESTLGQVIAVARLSDEVPVEDAPPGPFTEGPWCWILEDVKPLSNPFPWRATLGIFVVTDDRLAMVESEAVR